MTIFLIYLKAALILITGIQLIFLIHFQLSPTITTSEKKFTQNTLYTTSKMEEKFNPNLSYLNTMSKLEEYFLLEIGRKELQGKEIVSFADNLIRDRFMHDDAFIRLKDNWILHAFNFFTPHRDDTTYLSSLNPDYILKFDGAICNQQAIIFQQLMKAYHLDYQSVLFNIPRSPEPFGHFASAVKVNNEWIFIDTNLEPQYDSGDTKILDALLGGDVHLFNHLYPSYKVEEIPKGSIRADHANQNPAFYGRIFQDFCYFLSWYGWAASLICYFLISRLKKKFIEI